MADFDVARLITVLGARFDPAGFEAYSRAIGDAGAEGAQLRRDLARDYPSAALTKYAFDVQKLQQRLAALRVEQAAAVRQVTLPGGQTRYRGPSGQFIPAHKAQAEQAAYTEEIAATEKQLYGLMQTMERVSRQAGTLAAAEERSAQAINKAYDSVALGLAKLEVAAGQASFKLQDFTGSELNSLEKVALGYERASIQAEQMRDRVSSSLDRMTSAEEKAAAAAGLATRSIREMTIQERRAALEAVHAARDHDAWGARLRSLAGIVAVTFGAEQIWEQIKRTQEAANLFQEAQARLQVSMRNAGLSWGRYQRDIEGTTHALRDQSGFTDFEIQDSLANAIRVVGKAGTAAERYARAWRIVQASLDLARTKHIGLQAATTLTAQATVGYARGLARLGIHVAAVTTEQDKLRGRLAAHREEFAKWLTHYRSWVSDQVAILHYRSADTLAIKAFTDATQRVIEKRREEQHATENQQRAQLNAAKQADKTRTGILLLNAISSTFAGQATAYGHTLTGSWARFKAQIDATRESTSRELLPALTKVVDYLSVHLVGRVGTEIDRLNGLWLDMGHSVRDIAISFLPMMQGAAEATLGSMRVLFAVMAPLLHDLSMVVGLLGGTNIGVFVATWWGAGRAMKFLSEATKGLRWQIVADTFASSFQVLTRTPGILNAIRGALGQLGTGLGVLAADIGPAGWVAIGLGVAATAVYILMQHTDRLTESDKRLHDALSANSNAYRDQLTAIRSLHTATLGLRDAQQSLKDVDGQIISTRNARIRAEKELAKLEEGGISRAERTPAQRLRNQIRDYGSRLVHLGAERGDVVDRIAELRDARQRTQQQIASTQAGFMRNQAAALAQIMTAATQPTSFTQHQIDVARLWTEQHPQAGIQVSGTGQVRAATASPLNRQAFSAFMQRQGVRAPDDQRYLRDLQGRLRSIVKDSGDYSTNFRLGADAVLRMSRNLQQVRSLSAVRIQFMLTHGQIAHVLEPLQRELRHIATPHELRFLMSHASAKNLAGILEFAKTHQRLPTVKELRAEVNRHSVVDVRTVFSRLVAQISHPKITTVYDAAQIQRSGTAIADILQQQMKRRPIALDFVLPDGTSISGWLAKNLPANAGAGQFGGVITVPTAATPAGAAPVMPTAPHRRGGAIRRPTLALMGEEAPRYVEYVFSTNPRDRSDNRAAFAQLAALYGLHVEPRATGTAPDGTGGAVNRALDNARKTETGHKGPRQRHPRGRKPVDLFTDAINAQQELYTEAYDRLDQAMAVAERTRNFADDFRVNQAIISLERWRMRTIQRELRDPRFSSFRSSGTLQDRNTAQQAYDSLLQEQTQLYRDVTQRERQGPQIDVTQILTPREQYQLDEAARRGDATTQYRILQHEMAILDRQRQRARAHGQWNLADQLSQQEAQVQSQIQGLAPSQQAGDYLSQLQGEAAELLAPSAYFQREVRAARGVRTGHFDAPARGTTPLATLAAGQAPVQINVNTLLPGDPRTLREIHRAAGAASAQVQHRRNPRRRVRG